MPMIDGVNSRVYGAYGYRVAATIDVVRTGHAGEVGEADLPWYYLGERFYVPWLRRFANADRASPFEEGGLNRYAFCAGDPMNRIDPSGRGWLDWLFTGIALAGAVIGTIATGGVLAGVLAGTITATVATTVTLAASTVLSVASIGVEIAAAVFRENGDMALAQTLGWASMGTGLASSALAGLGMVGARAGQFAGGGLLLARSGRALAASAAFGAKAAAGAQTAKSGAQFGRAAAGVVRNAVGRVTTTTVKGSNMVIRSQRETMKPLAHLLEGPSTANRLINEQLGKIPRAVTIVPNVVGFAGPFALAPWMQRDDMQDMTVEYSPPRSVNYAWQAEEVMSPSISEDEWRRLMQADPGSGATMTPHYSPYALAAVDGALMRGLNMDMGEGRKEAYDI